MSRSINIANRHVLYVSCRQEIVNGFLSFVSCGNYDCDFTYPFSLSTKCVKHAVSLFNCIAEARKSFPRNLYVIIDYLSFYTKDVVAKDDYASVVRTAIIAFPEINFFFDESIAHDNISFHRFLGCDDVYQRFHSFKATNDPNANPFEKIFLCDNLFDASCLRLKIKMLKRCGLKVSDNYERQHRSRGENLCLCVEEERSQVLFNSYSMYANGYRAMPVTTSKLLKEVNDDSTLLIPSVIIRDYDLQFPDENGSKEDEFNETDKIRGWAYKDGEWKSLLEDSVYWKNLVHTPIVYVTKGIDKKGKDSKELKTTTKLQSGDKEIKGNRLTLFGLYKPVSGLYYPFWELSLNGKNLIKDRHDASIDIEPLDLERENHDHGAPLDIYTTAREMISRANAYFNDCKYVHSAMVAREALEFLNGFHQQLMLKAIHVLAMAETAISANTLGGDESSLANDVSILVAKIEKEVRRCHSHSRTKNDLNVVNQIFADSRLYCHEKEHFKSEEVFINAMAELNDGGPCPLFKKLKNLFVE